MKLYNNELNLVLRVISELRETCKIEIHGDLVFNLNQSSKRLRKNIDNNKLTILCCDGQVYINELENIIRDFSLVDFDIPLEEIKSFLWLDMLMFNKITVNDIEINKETFLCSILDKYMKFLKTKCLILTCKIRDKLVKFNYYEGGLVQRTFTDYCSEYERTYMTIFENTLSNLYKRHNSLRLVGVSANHEIAYPGAYYKQLARVSNMSKFDCKLTFKVRVSS